MIRRRSQRIHDKVKLSSPSSNSGDGNHMDMRLNKIHDYFNLICLPFICACYVWHMNTLYNMPKDPDPITIFSLPRHSNNSNAWFYNYWTFNIYIIIDTLWILLYPRCVASPNTLLAHHVVCVIGWQLCSLSQWGDGNDNHYQFNWEYYISAGLCVEFNTYFLILKRQLPKPKPPNDNDDDNDDDNDNDNDDDNDDYNDISNESQKEEEKKKIWVEYTLKEEEDKRNGTSNQRRRSRRIAKQQTLADDKIRKENERWINRLKALLASLPLYHICSVIDNVTWAITRLVMFPLVTYNHVCVWLHLANINAANAAVANATATSININSNSFGASIGNYINSGLYTAISACLIMSMNILWTKAKFTHYIESILGSKFGVGTKEIKRKGDVNVNVNVSVNSKKHNQIVDQLRI